MFLLLNSGQIPCFRGCPLVLDITVFSKRVSHKNVNYRATETSKNVELKGNSGGSTEK